MGIKIGNAARTDDQTKQKRIIPTGNSISTNDLDDGEIRSFRGNGVSGVGMHNSSNPPTRALNGIRTMSEKLRKEHEGEDE